MNACKHSCQATLSREQTEHLPSCANPVTGLEDECGTQHGTKVLRAQSFQRVDWPGSVGGRSCTAAQRTPPLCPRPWSTSSVKICMCTQLRKTNARTCTMQNEACVYAACCHQFGPPGILQQALQQCYKNLQILPSTRCSSTLKRISGLALHLTFHCFSPFNPFTAPACKISGLKHAWTHLWTVYFLVL